MRQADHVLLVYLKKNRTLLNDDYWLQKKYHKGRRNTHIERSLEFARRRRETVQYEIFTDAVDKFAARAHHRAYKVATFSFTAGEGSHYLSLHVHDYHGIGTIAHDKVLRISWKGMHTVHCEIGGS